MESRSTVHISDSINQENQKSNNQDRMLFTAGVVILLLVTIVSVWYFFILQKNKTSQSISQNSQTSASLPPGITSTTPFLKILSKACLTKDHIPMSGTIDIGILPINLQISDVKSQTGSCDADYSKYVEIELQNNAFATVSTKDSFDCCHNPSTLKSTKNIIKNANGIQLSINTGPWDPGPGLEYRPVFVRGAKEIKTANGETLTVIVDREAIPETDKKLQDLEEKSKAPDTRFETGKKILTPQIIEKMLSDKFFSSLADSQVAKQIESDLQNITAK